MGDSIYRIRHADVLALCVMGLLALGVIMVHSAAMNATGPLDARLHEIAAQRKAALAGKAGRADVARINAQFDQQASLAHEQFNERTAHWHWAPSGTRQLTYAVLAMITFFLVGRFDYTRLARGAMWRTPIMWILIIASAACFAVLVPGVGREMNGARRWISLGFTQFQPSEVGKWAAVAFLAWWLAHRKVVVEQFMKGFVPTVIPVLGIAALVVIQDFGTAALILLGSVAIMVAGRVRLWHLAAIAAPVILGGIAAVIHKPYRLERITAFMHPFDDPQGKGYHMIQALFSFSSGGIFGRGLGNGVQKLGYLPEDTTDFIFGVICEETGLFGALLTILLYLGILHVAFQVVRQSRDNFGRLLAFGVGTMIGLQALLNIAVATVSVPTKGLSLPLVSYGGTGLIITCAALGLLQSVTLHSHPAEEEIQSTLWQTDSLALANVL